MNHFSPQRTAAALAVLFVATFVLGSVERIMSSVPDQLSDDMGTPFNAAGTAYTLGLVVGGPLLTVVSIRLNPRPLLLLSMAASVLVMVATALTSGAVPLLVDMAVAGSLYCLFFGVACVVAVSMAPFAWLGRAVSVLLGGSATAALLGPLLGIWRGSAVLAARSARDRRCRTDLAAVPAGHPPTRRRPMGVGRGVPVGFRASPPRSVLKILMVWPGRDRGFRLGS
ncbi:hypothetical protein [Nonomuraea sp. NPDC049141]|uniref:hypothetical protein n=1 Tax=Nonomuraea sp. NPDC049141 TaxID=3155500 RepID=UPI0033D24168